MDEEEIKAISRWVQLHAANWMGDVPPGMITNAEPSRAVRFRWFGQLKINSKSYNLGANVHYGGSMGGLWITNVASDKTLEFHPHAPPSHGLGSNTAKALFFHAKGHKDPTVAALHKLIA